MESGDDLSSRAVSSQVLSTLKGLTSVFGMGTGGTPSPLSPEIVNAFRIRNTLTLRFPFAHPQNLIPFPLSRSRVLLCAASRAAFAFLDQALDRLVLTSFHITAFTPSTYQPCRLQGVLPAYAVGYFFSRGGFTLRCLQRLSRPYFASLLCRWHDNSCTRGTSIPVLSY